jgi:hypothetical protein
MFKELLTESNKYKKGTTFTFDYGSNNGVELGYRTDHGTDRPTLLIYRGHHPDIDQYMGYKFSLKKKLGDDTWLTDDGFIISTYILDELKDDATIEKEEKAEAKKREKKRKKIENFKKKFLAKYEVGDRIQLKKDVFKETWGGRLIFGDEWEPEDKTFARKGTKKEIKRITDEGIKIPGYRRILDWDFVMKMMGEE